MNTGIFLKSTPDGSFSNGFYISNKKPLGKIGAGRIGNFILVGIMVPTRLSLAGGVIIGS